MSGSVGESVVLPVIVEQLRREKRRLREYMVAPGGDVQCAIGPDDDAVLARLAADLRGVQRVDLVSEIDGGPEERIADIPFDPSASEVILAPSPDLLRQLPSHVQRLRLVAVEGSGDRVLGEYTFHHTGSPGAGGGGKA